MRSGASTPKKPKIPGNPVFSWPLCAMLHWPRVPCWGARGSFWRVSAKKLGPVAHRARAYAAQHPMRGGPGGLVPPGEAKGL